MQTCHKGAMNIHQPWHKSINFFLSANDLNLIFCYPLPYPQWIFCMFPFSLGVDTGKGIFLCKYFQRYLGTLQDFVIIWKLVKSLILIDFWIWTNIKAVEKHIPCAFLVFSCYIAHLFLRYIEYRFCFELLSIKLWSGSVLSCVSQIWITRSHIYQHRSTPWVL